MSVETSFCSCGRSSTPTAFRHPWQAFSGVGGAPNLRNRQNVHFGCSLGSAGRARTIGGVWRGRRQQSDPMCFVGRQVAMAWGPPTRNDVRSIHVHSTPKSGATPCGVALPALHLSHHLHTTTRATALTPTPSHHHIHTTTLATADCAPGQCVVSVWSVVPRHSARLLPYRVSSQHIYLPLQSTDDGR